MNNFFTLDLGHQTYIMKFRLTLHGVAELPTYMYMNLTLHCMAELPNCINALTT